MIRSYNIVICLGLFSHSTFVVGSFFNDLCFLEVWHY